MKCLQYFLLLIMISACRPSENLIVTLSPLPNFIIELSLDDGLAEDDILCMSISQKPLWESGEDDGSLFQHIYRSIQVKVDNTIVPTQYIDMRVNPISYPIFDDDQELLGSFGGNIRVCIKDDGLNMGIHELDVAITNLSDEVFSYNTRFSYNPSERTRIYPTLIVLPTAEDG